MYIMKKLILCFIIFDFLLSCAYSGELQQQYETENSYKYKLYENQNVSYVIKNDLKHYKLGKYSVYGQLLKLYSTSDEVNYDYLKQIEHNFKSCRKNTACWSYIDVDDYRYKWLDNDSKDIILFNNIIYSNK